MSQTERKRIGLLLPSSNSTQEYEFARYLPAGISVHSARLSLRNIEPDSIGRVVDEIEHEARKLADAAVDVVILAATAPGAMAVTSKNGKSKFRSERELIERIGAASGRPATLATIALVQALQALKVERIAVGGPWTEMVNGMNAAFLEAKGFHVTAQKALGIVSNKEIGDLDEKTALAMAQEVDTPDADAVFVACGNWQTLGIIEHAEKAIGKPVVSTNLVSLWALLHMLGRPEPLPGLGALLRDSPPPATGEA